MNGISIFDDHVIKRFSDPQALEKELFVYRRALPFCPKLLEVGESWLVLERLPGTSLQLEKPIPALDLLAKTIASFHREFYDGKTSLCHYDNNPKNILWDTHRYYLIDFEESCRQAPESDLSHLFLFWLDLPSPEAIRKQIESFVCAYNSIMYIDTKRYNMSVSTSVKRFIKRRQQYGKPIPSLIESPELLAEILFL